jgi:hypothetical protein
MAETKMIKHLMFTYGKEVDNPLYIEGGDQPQKVLQEGLGRLGEEVELTRDYDIQRGEELGAFFTDEQVEAIKDGSYRGPDAPQVVAARLQAARQVQQEEEDEETQKALEEGDASGLSVEQLAEKIQSESLNVNDTIDLADESDVNSINKVLDAENMATNNEPRQGVVRGLEARLAKASEGGEGADEE